MMSFMMKRELERRKKYKVRKVKVCSCLESQAPYLVIKALLSNSQLHLILQQGSSIARRRGLDWRYIYKHFIEQVRLSPLLI